MADKILFAEFLRNNTGQTCLFLSNNELTNFMNKLQAELANITG
jgi:hypothetical protein